MIFLWNALVQYTTEEVNAFKQFAEEGGRLVFIGEWDGYYGAGIALENQFLLDLGAVMTNIGQAVDCGYTVLPSASLRPHQITIGMTDVTVACASVIVPGPQDYPLFYDTTNTQVLAGVAKIDTTPLPLTMKIFNTGVDANGVFLPDGTVGDPHYTLFAVPSGTTTDIQVLTPPHGEPCNSWDCTGSLSAWIGPNTDIQATGENPGTYTYRTTFDLSGFDPTTASLAGRWMADNGILNILLNDVPTVYSGGAFNFWSLFTINSGFGAGVNTLDFIVVNGGGPTGLRVEVTGNATNNVPIDAHQGELLQDRRSSGEDFDHAPN